MAVTVGLVAVVDFDTLNQRIDKRRGKLLNVGHLVVTGFEIQSRNCLLRLSVADSSKQFRSSGISFSHTAGVYGAKPYFQIL